MDHLLPPAGGEAARPAADVRGAPRASPSVARRARSFLSRIAAERGTTYVLMGTPRPRNALRASPRPRCSSASSGSCRRRPAHRRRPQPSQHGRPSMRPAEIVIFAVLGLGVAVLGALYVRDRRRRALTLRISAKRILLPFVLRALSRRAPYAGLPLD